MAIREDRAVGDAENYDCPLVDRKCSADKCMAWIEGKGGKGRCAAVVFMLSTVLEQLSCPKSTTDKAANL